MTDEVIKIEDLTFSTPDDQWEIVINVKGWKMKDKRKIAAAMTGNDKTVDESVMYPVMAKSIKKWAYEYDPTLVDSYDELTIEEFEEAAKRFGVAFQKANQ